MNQPVSCLGSVFVKGLCDTDAIITRSEPIYKIWWIFLDSLPVTVKDPSSSSGRSTLENKNRNLKLTRYKFITKEYKVQE